MLLVGYATRYGSTQEVAESIAATLRERNLAVDIKEIKNVHTLTDYDGIILGAPLFMFHWHKDALRFLSKYRKILKEIPVAIFAPGPIQDPFSEKEWQGARDQLNKELAKFPWFKPVTVEIFGGKFDPSKLRFPLKMFAGKMPASDIRDWTAIRTWAGNIGVCLKEHINK
jgi:menaquinone-dependent protoporphyrinogen oxidase